jgi:hypothetical protein
MRWIGTALVTLAIGTGCAAEGGGAADDRGAKGEVGDTVEETSFAAGDTGGSTGAPDRDTETSITTEGSTGEPVDHAGGRARGARRPADP